MVGQAFPWLCHEVVGSGAWAEYSFPGMEARDADEV